jgi:DUF1365 family protein
VSSRIYRGHLEHARGGSVKNRFRYPVYTACLDLGELGDLDRRLRLFSLERRNLFSLRNRDYALAQGTTRPSRRPAPAAPLEERARERLAAAGVDLGGVDRIYLLTQLRVLGHVFNPVSFFAAVDRAGQVAGVIAEINNTHDQTFAYALGPTEQTGEGRYTTAKRFFVSPFIADDADYRWNFAAVGGAELDVRMTVSVRGRPMFSARLDGRSRPMIDLELLRAFVRLPALPAQIWGRIHWQALRLRLLGLQYRRPLP